MGASQSKTDFVAAPSSTSFIATDRRQVRARASREYHPARSFASADNADSTTSYESDAETVLVERKRPAPYTRDSPVSHDVSISSVAGWEKELLDDPKNRLAIAAFGRNPTTAIISSSSVARKDVQNFNIKIPIEGLPITDQKASGRCWLFASTNVFRTALMKKHNLDKFELSQAYLFFWDKLEKANYFLESILETAGEPLDGRLVSAVLASPVGDGGQWDMAANLVHKYGLVPHDVFPDSWSAQNSSSMDWILTTKLREDALRLRGMVTAQEASAEAISTAKEAMLREVHSVLTLMLGPPPKPDAAFEWEHYDASGAYKKLVTTPLQLAKELSAASTVRALGGTDVNRAFSLVNDPRNAYETLLTVDHLGNVWNGRPVTYVNCKPAVLKEAAIATLKKGLPVFFGCDVGKFSDGAAGIMDTKIVDYELGFNVRLGLTKAERLATGASQMTHAMTLTAVHVDPSSNKSVRWRVQNSWGPSFGSDGYYVMTDEWFDEYVFQVVVDPSVVSKGVRDVLGSKPRVLSLWDPMGALA